MTTLTVPDAALLVDAPSGWAATTTLGAVTFDLSDDPFRLGDALDGDEAAWNHLVGEFSTSMWHWARSYGLDRDDAADVAQMVWFKLKDKGHTIEDRRRLAGWLATTTKREAISMVRRRSVRIRHIDMTDEAMPEPVALPNIGDPYQSARLSELHQALAAAYRSLSDRCRQLLALCWDDSLTYADMAQMLDVSVGYIGPTRRRCLDQLRAEAGLTSPSLGAS